MRTPPPLHTCNPLAYELLLEALALPLPAPRGPAPGSGRRPVRRTVSLPSPEPVPTPPADAPARPIWTVGSATAALHAFVAHHGHVPTREEWRHPTVLGLPNPGFIRHTWRTLAACYQQLGLTPNPPRGQNQHTHAQQEEAP